MARYIDADALMEMLNKKAQTDLEMGLYNHGTLTQSFIRFVERQPTADVAPMTEVFEAVDKFRNDLMDKFIDLCRGNDYNKLTLLKIDDVVCEIYDKQIASLKDKYTGESQ